MNESNPNSLRSMKPEHDTDVTTMLSDGRETTRASGPETYRWVYSMSCSLPSSTPENLSSGLIQAFSKLSKTSLSAAGLMQLPHFKMHTHSFKAGGWGGGDTRVFLTVKTMKGSSPKSDFLAVSFHREEERRHIQRSVTEGNKGW